MPRDRSNNVALVPAFIADPFLCLLIPSTSSPIFPLEADMPLSRPAPVADDRRASFALQNLIAQLPAESANQNGNMLSVISTNEDVAFTALGGLIRAYSRRLPVHAPLMSDPLNMPSAKSNPAAMARGLVALLNDRGQGDYIGESISQLEHCLQAADLASKAGSPEETIIAALLHDIGQFLPIDEAQDLRMSMGDACVGRIGHETIGEEYLRDLGFGENVCRLVGSHVAAKRYLTAIDQQYYENLSDASKKSLKFQGGPFQGKELEAFKRDPLSEDMVRLRRCDDAAKVVGVRDRTPRPEVYEAMIARHLEGRVLA